METEATIHLNKAECLKSAMHFGFRRVHDVCSGTTVDVPWGGVDWVGATIVAGLGIALAAFVFAMVTVIIREL